MKLIYIIFFLIADANSCVAQNIKQVDSLCRICTISRTEPEKIDALNNLANYYYQNKFYKQADSVLIEQLHIAELSNNNDLILKTYFDNYITGISAWSVTEDFDKTSKFIEQGIDFAKSINDYDHIAIGYTRLACILRKRGSFEKAVENATTALMGFQNIKSDSVKALVYIELGDDYHSKGQSVQASKSYNNAFDIALKSKNHFLESDIYHRLANLYYDLGDLSEAKNNLLKSVGVNKKATNGEGLIHDYTELARVTDDTFYIKLALSLSDSLHIDSYKLRVKNILLAIYMTKLMDSRKALEYLNSQAELKETFMQGGIANYYFELGEIYRYANNPDSALYYFKLAEPDLFKTFDASNAKYIFSEMAFCYDSKNDKGNAIKYYEKTLTYCKGDLLSIASISNSLSELFQQTGDFKKAFNYKMLATETQDSVTELSRNKDIALLEVARETRKHEEELLQEEQRLKNERNIQYMAITIAISIVFLCMLIIGMFAVSKLVIKILGYFFFISLFEFIVLLIDNNILENVTHGQPLKLWLIKIGLIGLLVPVQHFMETTLIKFLESRKLLEARNRFSVNKLWKKLIKKSSVEPEISFEKDSAVL